LIAEYDFDCHLVAEQRSAGAIDGTHPTLGEGRQNLIPPVQDLAGREHGSN
jgi:hypothetical protein